MKDESMKGLVLLPGWGLPARLEAQDRLADRRCIGCGAGLMFEMDSDCYYASCCAYLYHHPLLRGDLITVGDSHGNVWEA